MAAEAAEAEMATTTSNADATMESAFKFVAQRTNSGKIIGFGDPVLDIVSSV